MHPCMHIQAVSVKTTQYPWFRPRIWLALIMLAALYKLTRWIWVHA